MWVDQHGKCLSDYPRPSVAVDVALLTVVWTERQGQLSVLLHKPDQGFAAGKWCLPGTFVHEEELLSRAALRALSDKVGVRGGSPRQLKVFDALDRDERGRVLSVAHVDVVLADRLSAPDVSCTLAPIVGERAQLPGRQKRLPYDHDLIVAEAVAWVRSEHRRGPDPFGLLAPEFTLSDLQRLHEAVAGERLVKDTFRRGVLPALVPTGYERLGSIGRPAALYRRHSARPLRH